MDELAYRDSLTGAGNKAAYEKAVRKLDWDILAGTADFAIVMGDLNYLKRINDSYGHDKGNVYIKGMHAMLAEAFQESPIFRIGGDEFVVIVQDRELECCEDLVGRPPWADEKGHAGRKSGALGANLYRFRHRQICPRRRRGGCVQEGGY